MIEVLHYASQNETSVTRIMLDNMVVPLPNGDVDVSMLTQAVGMINGRFETEVAPVLFLYLHYFYVRCIQDDFKIIVGLYLILLMQ